MVVVMMFVIGFLAGGGLMMLINRVGTVGSLRIDMSIPDDEPYLFLELDKELSRMINKKYIVLKVNKDAYLPHKKQSL